MHLTVKQQVKHLSKEDYKTIKELCHIAKNLANEAIYNVRQYYFIEGEFLKYEKNYTLLKNSPNYKLLNSNMAQQILKHGAADPQRSRWFIQIILWADKTCKTG